MKYNLFTLTNPAQKGLVKINSNELPVIIRNRISVIKEEIFQIYIKEQKGKIGIKGSLGNQIRYNKTISNQFGQLKDGCILIN